MPKQECKQGRLLYKIIMINNFNRYFVVPREECHNVPRQECTKVAKNVPVKKPKVMIVVKQGP